MRGWPRHGSLLRRLVVFGVAFALIVGAALLVSDLKWRDELPRSTIAAVALGMIVLVTLWLFGSSGSKTALGAISAAALILAAAGSALNLDQRLPPGPPPPGALVDCPDYPSGRHPDGYVATTDLGYTLVRAEPNFSSDVLLRYPPGCRLAFDGYCLGEPKDDWRFHVRDPVWFSMVTGDGYLASADIRAGPGAGSVDLLQCAGGERPPRPPEITAPVGSRLSGPVDIAVAAPGAIQVGFAVYYPEVAARPSSARWHQIGVDLNTGDGISAIWDSRSVPGQGERLPAAVTLLAVPCLGLEFPDDDYVTRSYVVANRGGPEPSAIEPPGDSFREARQMACDNVER